MRRAVYAIDTTTNYSSSDYNGFNTGTGAYAFAWNSPPSNTVEADYDWNHKLTARRFKTLKDYSAATDQDKHSVTIGYDIFVSAPKPDDSDPQHLYNPEDMDFRLKPHSAAIDAGVALATINDGFAGRAPDLGAYELGGAVRRCNMARWCGRRARRPETRWASARGMGRRGRMCACCLERTR